MEFFCSWQFLVIRSTIGLIPWLRLSLNLISKRKRNATSRTKQCFLHETKASHNSCISHDSLSVIRQRANFKTEVTKKQTTPDFLEFLLHIREGVRNVPFSKIWTALFSCYLHFEVSSPMSWGISSSLQCSGDLNVLYLSKLPGVVQTPLVFAKFAEK